MSGRRFLQSAAVLGAGGLLAGALFWALLSVPESNAAALALSTLLIVLVLTTTGVACGMAAATASDRTLADSARGSLKALPNFFVGVMLFAILWWATGSIDAWWASHRGEIDAVFLRYLKMTRTSPLHTAASWTIWLVRWAMGLSIVIACVTAGVRGGVSFLARGLRGGMRLGSLMVAAGAVSIISEALWRLVYWRPSGLPPTWVEPTFAALKLVVLYVLALAIATLALSFHVRATRIARES
jgi:hypothetical protein